MSPPDALELHERLYGAMPDAAFEALSAAILDGAALPPLEPRHAIDAASLATAMAPRMAVARRAGMTADAVVDDLDHQHVGGDAAALLRRGLPSTATLLVLVHEGYPIDPLKVAMAALSREVRGVDVALAPMTRPYAVPGGEGDRPARVVVRHGNRVLTGIVEHVPDGATFRGDDLVLPLDALDQVWAIQSAPGDRP